MTEIHQLEGRRAELVAKIQRLVKQAREEGNATPVGNKGVLRYAQGDPEMQAAVSEPGALMREVDRR